MGQGRCWLRFRVSKVGFGNVLRWNDCGILTHRAQAGLGWEQFMFACSHAAQVLICVVVSIVGDMHASRCQDEPHHAWWRHEAATCHSLAIMIISLAVRDLEHVGLGLRISIGHRTGAADALDTVPTDFFSIESMRGAMHFYCCHFFTIFWLVYKF